LVSVAFPETISKEYLVDGRRLRTVTTWMVLVVAAPRTSFAVVVGVAVPATHRIDPVTALSVVHDTVNAESRTLATVTKRVRPAAPGVGEAVGDAVGEITAVAVAAGTGVATGLAALTTRATATGIDGVFQLVVLVPLPPCPFQLTPQQ